MASNCTIRCREPAYGGRLAVGSDQARAATGLLRSRGRRQDGIVASFVGGASGREAWILRLVEIGAEGDEQAQDVTGIDRPRDLGDIGQIRDELVFT